MAAYDLVAIGSGAAGFAAAIEGRRLGADVALVERATVGGTCVNIGCIPSKALLAAAEELHAAQAARQPGVWSQGSFSWGEVRAGKDALVNSLRGAKYEDVAAAWGFPILRGEAAFAADGRLVLDGAPLEARTIVIATGASPVVPPIPGLADVRPLTSTEVLGLGELPRSIAVIGGGAIGLELGQMLARLGVRVTLLEALERLAATEEPEASATIQEVLESEGVVVRTGIQVARARRASGAVTLELADGSTLTAEEVLVATGRRPRTAGLGLAHRGITVSAGGGLVVDDTLRTSDPMVFGAGDVLGQWQLVYLAAAMGTLAARNALGNAHDALDLSVVPRVTFTSPQIASVGMTDEEAARTGSDCSCRVLPLEVIARAQVARQTTGFVKIVAERATGRILGATVVADQAGETIAAATLAIKAGLTTDELAGALLPYLTMTEGLKLAAQSFVTDPHLLSCCAG